MARYLILEILTWDGRRIIEPFIPGEDLATVAAEVCAAEGWQAEDVTGYGVRESSSTCAAIMGA